MKKLFVVSILSALIGGAAAQATTIQENTVFPDNAVVISQLNDASPIGVRDIPNPVHAVCGQSFTLTNATTIRAITVKSHSTTTWNTGDDNIQLWIGADTDANVTNFVAGTTNLLTSFDVQGLAVTAGNYYTINLDSDLVLPAGDYAFQFHWTSTAGSHQWFFRRANGNGDYDDGGLIFVQKTDGSFVDYPTDASNLLLTSDMVFALHSTVVGTVPEFSVDPGEIDMLLGPSETLSTGTVTAAYSADSTMDISMTISDESHPGSFSILSANPQTLVSPTNNVLEFQYDNTVSNLTAGAATGLVTIAWSETGSGITNETLVPIGVALASPATFTRGGTDTTWDGLPGWNSNESGTWGAATRLPLGIDTVVLNNAGIADDALYVDVDAEVKSISIVNTATSAALAMTNDVTLSVLNGLNVGNPGTTGTGTVNQAAGTITVGGTLAIYTNTSAAIGGSYNLTGGETTVQMLNVSGLLDVNGGTFTIDNAGQDNQVSGTGLIKVQSGTLQTTANVATDVDNYECAIEVSGGTVNIGHQAYYTGGLTILGSAADVNIKYINANSILNFVLDADGVSTIDGTGGWATLGAATINIDGTAYTGGSTNLILHQSSNTTSPSTNATVNVTGFAGNYTTAVTVDEGNNNKVILEIVLGGYDAWAEGYGLTGDDALMASDVEPDGLDNLMEYALGGNPTNDDKSVVSPDTFTADDAGTAYFYHIHNERTDDDTLVYELGSDSDLVNAPGWDTNDVSFVGESGVVDSFKTVTNRTEATTGAKFIRLEVQKD